MNRTLASLKLLSLLTLMAVLGRAPMAAQEAPKPDLVRQYLAEKDSGKRKELRARLVALGGPALREAIARLEFAKPSETGALEFKTKCPDGFVRPYFMHVPPKYDAARRYPLIVWLHGGVSGAPAEAASEAIGLWQQALGEAWSNEVMVLAPAAIAAETTDDARWWRDKGQLNVLHVLREVKLAFNVDDERVFVTGMSDGGSGAFAFADRRPDAFAGFLPMVGHPLVPSFDGTRVFWENLGGLKIYAISGGKDRLYPAAQVATVIAEANRNGASIEHKIYEEAGHDLSYAPKEIPRILEDFVAKWKRDLLPKVIDWSTDSASMGRRSWLKVSELADLGEKNAGDFRAISRTGQGRVVLGITIDPESEPTDPVVVVDVAEGSVAKSLGIAVGDMIVKLDQEKIASLNDLRAALSKKKPGDEVEVTVERDGKEKSFKGRFPLPRAASDVLLARLKATVSPLKAKDERGSVQGTLFELTAANASRVTLYLTGEQVALGRVAVSINGGEALFFDKLAEDPEFILSEYERSADRKSPFVAKLEVDVAKALGVKVKPHDKGADDGEEGF